MFIWLKALAIGLIAIGTCLLYSVTTAAERALAFRFLAPFFVLKPV